MCHLMLLCQLLAPKNNHEYMGPDIEAIER